MPRAEQLPEPSNPLGVDGIEFIEYSTCQPQAFGALLLPLSMVAERACRSVKWIAGIVSRRSLPARRASTLGP
jgi:hypothetical protein